MKKKDKFHIFTLYFQETATEMRWIEALAAILCFADRFGAVEWRRQYIREINKVFLDIHKSGIYIDTIEQPRVAVFIQDSIDVEYPGKNGQVAVQTVKTWGHGGKTAAQLKRKLIASLLQVLEVWECVHVPDPDIEICREDVMGLMGFIAYEVPEENS